MNRNARLGRDTVWYCENSAGHVFLTTPESPIPEGFVRYRATTVLEVESVWKRIDQQERRKIEQMNEKMFNQRAARIKQMKDYMAQRLASADCDNAERDFIKESLKVLDRKEEALNNFSVYGVAHMQEKEAPLAPSSQKKVILTDA